MPARLLEEGRAAWPELSLAPEAFFAALATTLPEGTAAAQAIEALRPADFYLACACAAGDARAIKALMAQSQPDLKRALARIDPSPAFADDALQALYVALFVKAGAKGAGIADYRGQGSLRSFLRAAVVRLGLRLRTTARGQQAALEEAGPGLPGGDTDYIRRRYGRDFEAALALELAALPQKTRSLLRLHYVDGLSIDQLARVYHVSRATAARRLADHRAELEQATRSRLLRLLKITEEELQSLMGLVRSQLHLSLERVLR